MDSGSYCASIMQMSAAVSVLATVCVTGYFVSLRLRRVCNCFVEQLAVLLLSGLAVHTVLLTALALLGLFRPSIVLCSTVVVSGLLFCVSMKRMRRARYLPLPFARPKLWEWGVLLCIVGSCVWGLRVGSEDLASSRDPGVYACTAIELSRTGDLGWTDPLVSDVPIEYAKSFYEDINLSMRERPRWMFFPGFYLRDTELGIIEPQFLHVIEPWMALGYWVAGVRGLIGIGVLWCGLFLLIFAGVAMRLLGERSAAVGATFLVGLNAALLWYMRTPSNEAFAMCFLWGAILCFLYLVQQPRSKFIYMSLMLLLIAMCSKFAIWLYLPAFGFMLGWESRPAAPRYPQRHPVVAVFLLLLISLIFALSTSYWYTWGSAYVNFLRHGWHGWQVIAMLFVVAIASAWCGVLAHRIRLEKFVLLPRTRLLILCGCSVVLLVFYIFQSRELSVFLAQNPIHSDARWVTSMTLPQLSFYFGKLPFTLALIGIPFLLVALRKTGLLLILVILFSSLLLFRSGLDAVHPWCVRRWLIVLIPAFCLSLGALPVCLSTFFAVRIPRWLNLIFQLSMIVLVAIALPAVSTVRQRDGFCASGDRLASVLRDADFVVAQPSARVASLSGYLWSAYGIDMRPLQKKTDAWDNALESFRLLARAGKTVYFVSDVDSFRGKFYSFIHPVKKGIPFEWQVLEDGLMCPRSHVDTIDGTYFVWQIKGDEIPFGWHYPEQWNSTAQRSDLPLRNDDAGIGILQTMTRSYTPCDLPGKTGFWVNRTMQIYLGRFAKNDAPTSGGLVVTMRVSTGRKDADIKLNCGFYTDLARKNQQSLEQKLIGREPETIQLRIPYVALRPESVFYVCSDVTEVERSIPLGRAQGVLIEEFCVDEYGK